MGDPASDWDDVWASKDSEQTSWFQDTPEPCSELIRRHSRPTGRVAIVGAGTSRLVEDLLAHGYRHLEAVDISALALDRLRAQLAAIVPAGLAGSGHALGVDDVADAVALRQADVRTVDFDEPVDVWHDRATFHFLTDPDDQAAYAASAARAVRPGGHAIVATFALDGPERCSGLPVARYDATSLAAVFAAAFTLVDAHEHRHHTPWGTSQPFVYVVLRRDAGAGRR